MKCGIVIVDAGPLKTLAYGDGLDLLLAPKLPVFISDMVIIELRNGEQFSGNIKALAFIENYMGKGIEEVETGVPENFEKMLEVNVDPGDESIRRIINKYEDETDGGEYALLVSEDDKFMRTADPFGHTFMMTTRPFLQELEERGLIKDAEAIMIRAEEEAIAAGETPGRGQFNRRREWNNPPVSNRLVKPF
ncbi:MAG: hypothetical protein RL063_1918 [Pseudomonadota bacterium]|jgi:hypothetical protein